MSGESSATFDATKNSRFCQLLATASETALDRVSLIAVSDATVSHVLPLWCISHLKNYIDEEKIRQEPSIAEALRESLPPARILTEQGKKIRKIGFVSFAFALLLFLAMFIGRLLYPL